MVVSGPPLSVVKVPYGFRALLFIPSEPEVLTELKRTILHRLLPLNSLIWGFHTMPFNPISYVPSYF